MAKCGTVTTWAPLATATERTLHQTASELNLLLHSLISSHLTGVCLFTLILIKKPSLSPGSNTRKRKIKTIAIFTHSQLLSKNCSSISKSKVDEN